MRKLTTYLMARLSSVLVFIVALCICSVLVSVYYIHTSVLHSSPVDVLTAHNGNVHFVSRVLGDDTLPREGGGPPHSFINDGLDDDEILDRHGHDMLYRHEHDTLDKHQEHTPMAPDPVGGVEPAPRVLNDIDIALHIEKKKKKEQQAEGKGDMSPHELQQLQQPLPIHKKLFKKDQWPSHIKVYKERKAIVPLSMQIYNNPKRSRTDWSGERYLVYLCHSNLTCAGWGDRQHGIFSVYLLSLMTNRTFKVESDSPCPLHKLYHPRIVNWKINGTELHGLTSTHLYALNDRLFRDSMRVVDFNEEYPHDVVYLTTNYDYFYNLKANPHYRDVFRQKIRGRPRPIIFADLWQSVFKMNKRVVRRYTPAMERAHPTEKHKLICAHIRFGRNPTLPTDSDVRNTLATIKPLWKFLDQRSDPARYRMFIASDWEGFRDRVSTMYSNLTIQVEGDVMHIDKMKAHAKKHSTRNATAPLDPCAGFEKVIADQYVLSRCDVLLLTYSVFGKAAAYLRRSNHDLYLMENNTIKALRLFEEKYKPL